MSKSNRRSLRLAVVATAAAVIAVVPGVPSGADTTITFVAATSNDTAQPAGSVGQGAPDAESALVLSKPAGTAKDDLMVAQVTVTGGSNAVITAPNGWTLVLRTDQQDHLAQAIYWKLVGAGNSDPGPYTWGFDTTRKATGGILAYRGVDEDNPIDGFGGAELSASSSPTAPSIDPITEHGMLLAFCGIKLKVNLSTPTGMTERYQERNGSNSETNQNNTDEPTSSASDQPHPSDPTGTRTCNSTEITNNNPPPALASDWVAQLVHLRAALTGSGSSPQAECDQTAQAQNWEKWGIDNDGTLGTEESEPSGTDRIILTVTNAGNREYHYENADPSEWSIYRIVLKHGNSADDQVINNPANDEGDLDGASSLSHITFCLRLRTTLTLTKVVDNDEDGTLNPADFNIHVKSGDDDVNGSPQAGNGNGTVYDLVPGTYVVSEDAEDGYTATFSDDCDANGSVTLASGDNKECTITNEDSNLFAQIEVTKTPDVTNVLEPGDDVTFTVEVHNPSTVDEVEIDTLVDDVFGDLTDLLALPDSTCSLPQTIPPGDDYSCTFTGAVTGQAGDIHQNTVSASGVDEDGDDVEEEDTAEVDIDDVPSAGIEVTKTPDVTSVVAPGNGVTFTVDVHNPSSVDEVIIDTIEDDVFGDLTDLLSLPSSTCTVPQMIPPGGTYSCTFVGIVAGTAGDVHENTVTAEGDDDDGDPVDGDDAAQVDVTRAPSSGGGTGGGGGVVGGQVGEGVVVAARCLDLVATIVGPAGDSLINGTAGNDVIVDLHGNNTVRGNGGDDVICTGPGNDDVASLDGNDLVIDFGGVNRIHVAAGNDTIDAQGDNVIFGGPGADTIKVYDGTNRIRTFSGPDRVSTGDGDNFIRTGGRRDRVVTGDGDNDIGTANGRDKVKTGSGDDFIRLNKGKDIGRAGKGDNVLRGGKKGDRLIAWGGDDLLNGMNGVDTCRPGGGTNVLKSCEK